MSSEDASIQVPGACTHFRYHGWAAGALEQLDQKNIGHTLITEDVANVCWEILFHHENHLFCFRSVGNDSLNAAHNIIGLVDLGNKLVTITEMNIT